MLDAAPLVISEFLAVNNSGRQDADLDYSDWIEIHNPAAGAVSLEGWYLTDDRADLTKWAFPAMSLVADEYRVVFASGKDRTDPAELHTNFRLDGSGEYLALVGPDGSGGVEIVDDFFPAFPEQRVDVSYGASQGAAAFTLESIGLTYRVPQSTDAGLGTTWTAPDFDDSSWSRFDLPPQVLVTEAGTEDDFVEIQNLSGKTVDTSGWVVAVNNASGRTPNINNLNTIVWELPESMAPGEVLYRHDVETDPDHYWGENIFFRTASVGWVVIVDDAGNVVDFVVWGYTPAEVASLAVTVNGCEVTADGIWLGNPVASSSSDNPSLQRRGESDFDDASDWNFVPNVSPGATNDDLTVPFSSRAAASVGFEANPPGLEDAVVVDVAEAMHDLNASIWLRIGFHVDDPAVLDTMRLQTTYNDGFVAYLNGTEIARRNAPDSPVWNSTATAKRSIADSLQAEQDNVSRFLDLLRPGPNVLALHGLNHSAENDNALFLPQLVMTGKRYFDTPSPRGPNGVGFEGLVADTTFSVDRGFYEDPVTVQIRTDTPGATIHYTTDGSWPSESAGLPYTGPLSIETTTTLRAVAFRPDFLPSNVDTHTYIFPGDVIRQPAAPAGFPSSWTNRTADYEMDPRVVDDPRYSDVVQDALRTHPTISLVLDLDDLFDPATGIYSNSQEEGDLWERPTSVELLDFPGAEPLQLNAGLRLSGKASRNATRPKHNMRLIFREEYGAARLSFPLFDDTDAERFNSVILRGGNGDSFVNPGVYHRAQYMRDQWHRDVQVAMGQPTAAQGYVHLYINGLYWGLYHTIERVEDDLFAEHFGGEEEDWDVLKDLSGGANVQVIDGNANAWNATLALANAGLADAAQYEAIQEYLDLDNLIDYLLLNFYSGNNDWDRNNWRAARKREPGAGFMFFSWDAERTDLNRLGLSAGEVGDATTNVTGTNFSTRPTGVHQQLVANAEYRLRFADRVHKHFFNGGALTAQAAAASWNQRADEIRLAMVAESARWGDAHSSTPRTPADWEQHLGLMNTTFFPVRTGIVLGQLKQRNLYPDVVAPTFRIGGTYQHGGMIPANAQLTIAGAGGTVYYTLDGSDPRLPGGTRSTTALTYTNAPVTLNGTVTVKARALVGGEWSALNEAKFFVADWASAENLVVSELNYNPYPPTAEELTADFDDNDDFEFVELINTSDHTVYLGNLRFTAGIDFDFADGGVDTLAAGERIVVARNVDAFAARYGNAPLVVGGYEETKLDNNGERIALSTDAGVSIFDFSYNDGGSWPGRADGKGASLELVDPAGVPSQNPPENPQRTAYLEDPVHWRSTGEYGGTPGFAGVGLLGDVVINEVLTHTDAPFSDTIELHNTTGGLIEIGGWCLSDTWGWGGRGGLDDYMKFRIPDGISIPAGGYVVFNEDDFNPTPLNPASNHFALDGAHGDDVWLMEADAEGNLTRFVDHVEFQAAENGESFGRWPNGAGEMYPMLEPTLAPAQGENLGPRVGPLVISEVMYNPGDLPEADDLEFVEIYNPTEAAFDLTNWRIRKGVDFDFPAGTMLPAGTAMVIVSFDANDAARLSQFRDHYGIDETVMILGGYSQVLDNGGERIQLQDWDTPPADEPDYIPRLLEDEISYDDVSPWPVEADGVGHSLNRLAVDTWGHDAASWTAAGPTPGQVPLLATPGVIGRYVFYHNSALATPTDDEAIAPDKQALLPGETATFANYTSYALGINGLMVDLRALPPDAQLGTGDFEFRTGTDGDPDTWPTAPTPTEITVRRGAGDGGTDRVTIVFGDYAITNRWLQVTVLATVETGLFTPDVFYFGNAVGESGDSAADAKVNATDVLLTRNNPRTFLTPAPLDFHYDFNRDGRVNATDLLIARNNQTHSINALKLITVPDGKTAVRLDVDAAFAEEPDVTLHWLYDLEDVATERRTSDEDVEDAVDWLLAVL